MFRKIYVLIVLASFVMVMSHAICWAAEEEAILPESGSYIIGPGDVLSISVWKDEALTSVPTVLPDGFISFPLIGNMQAAGKTVTELKAEIEGKLVRYVPDIVLFLEVRQANSMIVYVIGRVNNPGRISLNANINVLQALSTAGGLNVFAKNNKIKIFREENGKTRIFPFEYDKIVKGENLEQNIRLKKGDIVVVP
ncbi:MAG: polysaccharide biosynthesis/export family protein [Pseudomonadota bacterium]